MSRSTTPTAMKTDWKETQRYLDSISTRGMKPGLERMERLMERFGHPEKKFKAIHVTGTNGKGSVCSMLESILRHAGMKTGFYSSPHLIDLGERIKVNSVSADQEVISYWVNEIRTRAEDIEPELTYFELLTAVAFCHFAEQEIEIAIVEVGLGGRLDSTNILPPPEICVITNVTLEHTDYLGKTIPEIAREKAAIVKENSVCVTGCSGEALETVRNYCDAIGIRPAVVSASPDDPAIKQAAQQCALKGTYQIQNIGLVLKSVDILRQRAWPISEEAVMQGLRTVRWPGRFDWRKIRLTRREIPLLLDGAHNPDAVKQLLLSIKNTPFVKKRCVLIFNVLRDKDLSVMIDSLQNQLNIIQVMIPKLGTERTSFPDDVKKNFRAGIPVSTFDSVYDLWQQLEIAPNAEWILATGSLYLVGEILRKLELTHLKGGEI